MPNWTQNEVTLKFKTKASFKKYITKYLAKADDGSLVVDYSLVIPSPKYKDYTVSPVDNKAVEALKREQAGNATPDDIKMLDEPHWYCCDESENQLTARQLAENSIKLKEETGYSDWYDWNVANWGVKWNASDSSIQLDEENLTVHEYFMSPWSAPEPVSLKLKEIFGNELEIEHRAEYEDEEGWHRIV